MRILIDLDQIINIIHRNDITAWFAGLVVVLFSLFVISIGLFSLYESYSLYKEYDRRTYKDYWYLGLSIIVMVFGILVIFAGITLSLIMFLG